MIDRQGTILLTGASGMVGGVTLEYFRGEGFDRILAPPRSELDLLNRDSVFNWFEANRPSYVLMIGAKVGGIAANIADPVGFLEQNLKINLNLFEACHQFGSLKNLFLGSSCIYPKGIEGLIREEDLLMAPMEPTNEGYALSKIVGLKLAKYYATQYGMKTVCPMISNVYGTGDHFDLGRAHVLSSLVRRFIDARDESASSVTLWGTGNARREFIHSTDAARAILFFMDHVESVEHINVGPGEDLAIRELAEMIADMVGYRGNILWDTNRPDGMLRKCMDVSKMRALGFTPIMGLREGIQRTIKEYEATKSAGRIP